MAMDDRSISLSSQMVFSSSEWPMKPAMWEGGRREAYGDGEKREGVGSGGWPADADRRGGEEEGIQLQ